MIGQMFGVDLLQHPDVPEGQMYIKRKPVENYQPQSMIADLIETRNLLVELLAKEKDGTPRKESLAITITTIDDNIMEQQMKIQKGPKS